MIGGLGAYSQNGILTTEFHGETDPIVGNRQMKPLYFVKGSWKK
jgi:hypothetical protein